MLELQETCVQKGPRKGRHFPTSEVELARRAISCVANDGVPEGCEVDPYLVRSASFGVGFEQCEAAEPADDLVTGDRKSVV